MSAEPQTLKTEMILPRQEPELLAPVGNWDCVKAAIENGADAVYFGLDRFNARMRADNFTEADLAELMPWLHQRGVKGYVTLNTLIFTEELSAVEQYLRSVIAAGVDAAIVQDVGLCQLTRHLSPDFPIHASTQMTITSAAGVAFAQNLGCQLVVLARECSLQEINKIQCQLAGQGRSLPLEVFVHGALCVAYSGQCLTSEALGGRSANRGECAQACRMPYELVVDGQGVDLGDRRYLLSPQDLAGLELLPELVRAGISCLKIEGRLKSPEYVANVTRVYRQALDRVLADWSSSSQLPFQQSSQPGEQPTFTGEADRYNLEMAFSRGLYTGWFQGINNQQLVHARFGKKRGVYLGTVSRIKGDRILVTLQAPVKPGDGVVFDNGHPDLTEEGGRIYAVEPQGETAWITFGRGNVNWQRVQIGDRLWKTSDPDLDRQLRQTFAGDQPKFQRPLQLEVHGQVDQPLTLIVRDEVGHVVQLDSAVPLVAAQRQPLDDDRLREQLGRLGNTPFRLAQFSNCLQGEVMLPVSELNRLRREFVGQLEALRRQPKRWQIQTANTLADLMPTLAARSSLPTPDLIVLIRTLPQLQAALEVGLSTYYCDFEDPRTYRTAVELVKKHAPSPHHPTPTIWVAPPRITKPSEHYILEQVKACHADGYLVRNYDHLQFFADVPCVGDFSLNVANPLTAAYFKQQFGLERLTASYDLNIVQLENLLKQSPAEWFEITLHQHMPMFHMEHCVFCAFLSDGTDYTNCGRPCDTHEVKLRDRVGTEHVLKADAGCRNTVFNGAAQTGAEYGQRLLELGLRHIRLEFLSETPAQVVQTIQSYQQLLRGEMTGVQLWRSLKLQSKLGVTRGPLDGKFG